MTIVAQTLPPPSHSRVFGLDLLRALAILFVVYSHAYLFVDGAVSEPVYTLPIFDGVSIFFVLSGYLIGRILIQTLARAPFDATALRTFWVRRWLRTLPNYFLILVFLLVSYQALGQPLPSNPLRYFFFSQNLFSPHPDFFPEAWSLAVEEWFYLIVPLLLYIIFRGRVHHHRVVLLQIILVIAFVTAARTLRAHELGFTTVALWDDNLRKQVFMRFDALMYGVLAAYISVHFQTRWRQIANRALTLGVLLFLLDKLLARLPATQDFYLNYLTFSVTGLAAMLLLPKLSGWQRSADPLTRAVTWISLISYAMYLLNHSPMLGVLLQIYFKLCDGCSVGGIGMYLAYWGITFLLSHMLYHYFERPITALRERLRPAPADPAPAPSQT